MKQVNQLNTRMTVALARRDHQAKALSTMVSLHHRRLSVMVPIGLVIVAALLLAFEVVR